MNFDDFGASLKEADPPKELPPLLRALWLDGHGDWTAAHEVAQECEGRDGAWVHAYLHRKEGDASNAAYWYGQASRPPCADTLDEEWETIARHLLSLPEPRRSRGEVKQKGQKIEKD
jgi:hypothetical protein